MPRLLLHVCCAPCATSPLKSLAREGWTAALFFFNPNLAPKSEHDLRLAEASRFAAGEELEFAAGGEDFAGWAAAVKGLEEEREGGRRCGECFRFRLGRTAAEAARRGMDAFATTLTVSPHKNAAAVAAAGKLASAEHGVAFLAADFKKKGGFQESVRISREKGLYRQDYCGCIYSMRARDALLAHEPPRIVDPGGETGIAVDPDHESSGSSAA